MFANSVVEARIAITATEARRLLSSCYTTWSVVGSEAAVGIVARNREAVANKAC